MRTANWAVLLSGLMIAGGASPAFSHHSHAMFDHAKFETITGTVIDFAYVNPHGSLDVAVEAQKNGRAEMVKYWFEMSNLSNMVQRGIRKTSFKPGDKVTITYHPLKDGRHGGSYTTIIAANGHKFE
jgi:hypothetical protein